MSLGAKCLTHVKSRPFNASTAASGDLSSRLVPIRGSQKLAVPTRPLVFPIKLANALLIVATRDFDPLDLVLVERAVQAGGPSGVGGKMRPID